MAIGWELAEWGRDSACPVAIANRGDVLIRRILAALGAVALAALAVATFYGIAMYREIQKPGAWLDSQEAGA